MSPMPSDTLAAISLLFNQGTETGPKLGKKKDFPIVQLRNQKLGPKIVKKKAPLQFNTDRMASEYPERIFGTTPRSFRGKRRRERN